MTEAHEPDVPETELPKELVQALRNHYGDQPHRIPERLDQTVLADAANHLNRSRGTVWRPRRFRAVSVTAVSVASLTVVALLLVLLPQFAPAPLPEAVRLADSGPADSAVAEAQQSAATALITDDIDQNGQVNILDAFALARNLEQGHSLSLSWDQNGDGQLNQDDVDQVALNAVML